MKKPTLKQQLTYSAVVTFGMAAVMSCVMSFTMLGLHSKFPNLETHVSVWLPVWGTAFIIAWPLAFCLSLVLIPRLLRIADRIHALSEKNTTQKKESLFSD